MRHIFGAIAVGAILLWAVTPAHAISIALDVPYSNNFKGTASGSTSYTGSSVSGYILSVGTPWWVGVAHEDYNSTIKIDLTGSGTKTAVKYLTTMNDVYVDLPVPVISAAIGYGVGSVKADVSGATSEDASQYFARLGLRIAMVFDVHLGYHTGTIKGSGGGGDTNFQTMTLGAGFKF